MPISSDIWVLLYPGTYSCLRVKMLFARQLSFFIVTVYVPCSMTVSVSWMSFWLDHKAVSQNIIIQLSSLTFPREATLAANRDNLILNPNTQFARFPPVWLWGWPLCWRCPPPRPASRTRSPPWPTPRPSTSGPGSVSCSCFQLSWSMLWSTTLLGFIKIKNGNSSLRHISHGLQMLD